MPKANRAAPQAPLQRRARGGRATSTKPDSGRRAIRARGPRRALSWSFHCRTAPFRFDEFSKFLELQPRPARRHLRDEPASVTVKKAALNNKTTKPRPRRCQPHGGAPVALSGIEHLLGGQGRIAFDFFLVLGERANRVVKQIPGQPPGRTLEIQRFVNDPAKLGGITAVKAPLVIRIPSRVFDPRTQVPGPSRHFINGKFRLFLLPCKERLLKFGAQLFVGIERQDPIIARGGSGKVL